MVSTHLKNISQNGSSPQVGMKIKNIWNHHLVLREGIPYLQKKCDIGGFEKKKNGANITLLKKSCRNSSKKLCTWFVFFKRCQCQFLNKNHWKAKWSTKNFPEVPLCFVCFPPGLGQPSQFSSTTCGVCATSRLCLRAWRVRENKCSSNWGEISKRGYAPENERMSPETRW